MVPVPLKCTYTYRGTGIAERCTGSGIVECRMVPLKCIPVCSVPDPDPTKDQEPVFVGSDQGSGSGQMA